MDLNCAIKAWRALLGESFVLIGEDAQHAYGFDTAGMCRKIPAALRITESKQLSEVMRIAHRYKAAVYPISTGRNWGYGTSLPVRDNCVIIDLSRLQSIVHFDAEFGVVTVEPGVTQAMLAAFLDAGGHPYLVPVTGGGPNCSLVGNALERGYGITPHSDHFGAVTDIEAILADGSRYRTALREAGGEELARLFKWGIGPYSVGLFTQSGFGIVTRMSIVLARRPDCVKACYFSLKEDSLLESAVERIRTIICRLPGIVGGINLMNRHRVLAMAAPYPKESLGPDGLIPEAVMRAIGKQYQIFPWTGFGSVYGTPRVVAAAQKEIVAALSGVASRITFFTPQGATALSKLVRWLPGRVGRRLHRSAATLGKALELINGRPNETALPLAYWRDVAIPQSAQLDPARDGCGLLWYPPLVPMRPESVRTYITMVERVTRAHGLEPLITLTSINDKVFNSTVPLIFDRQKAESVQGASSCYNALLHEGQLSGFFPYRVSIGAMESLSMLEAEALTFHARIKLALDPHHILAPGRYE